MDHSMKVGTFSPPKITERLLMPSKLISFVNGPAAGKSAIKNQLLSLWLWWVPSLTQTGIISSSSKLLGSGGKENSKESLFAGENLSDGCKLLGSWWSCSHQSSVQLPKGFVAVHVGPELRRVVIPTSFLSMPEFCVLLDKVAEEFGFEHQGALEIPCEEQEFEEISIKCLESMRSKNKKKRQLSNKISFLI